MRPRLSSRLLTLLISLVLGAAVGPLQAAAPQPLPTTTPRPEATIITNYYVFGGTNAALMRAAMIEARPWKDSMAYDAHTKWDIRSTYRYSRTNSQFKLNSADVKTKVEITLPRWIPGKPVTRELVNRWQKCFIGLSVHEQGHMELALAAAAEVKRRMAELNLFGSPQELTTAADRTLNDTLEEFRQRERRYDQVTGHGRTQGAVFPVEAEPDPQIIVAAGPTNGFPQRPGMRRR